MKSKNEHWLFLQATSILSLVAILYKLGTFNDVWLSTSLVIFGVITPILVFVLRNHNRLSFLITIVPTLVIIRVADQNDISLVGWLTALSIIPLLIQFVGIAREVYKENQYEFALMCIRLFVGFNFITHGTEKIFAGTAVHNGMRGYFGQVAGFDQIGPWFTDLMIYVGGITEIGVALLIGWGFFTRIGVLWAIAYLAAAEVLSGHFITGYTWALPGGGWEFPFFWAMVIYPFFFLKNQGPMSFDGMLMKRRYATN
ncbi:quinol oxidase [Photobacterium jeanii]|uniref:Quinol oxidase n=1 Tax=Photobacterium jeanii TaxID=858640 RepID=A0A178K9F4_9GAMM|nr:DoxX family protein [Photobacterium jeanii]OAN13312.1 quinol oxidase [Photobacterium jeanii]PST90311.1 DoxX family protein [Photobacterium jeanii]